MCQHLQDSTTEAPYVCCKSIPLAFIINNLQSSLTHNEKLMPLNISKMNDENKRLIFLTLLNLAKKLMHISYFLT
ncbi:hypothetical protein Hanom_Chr11g00977091 [Helianthus anomalus]